MQGAHRRTPRSAAKLGLTMLVVALLGAVAAIGTWSAFSSTTTNPGNTFTAGTVSLCDDDATPVNCLGGTRMFNLSGMTPGQSATPACIKVTYSGTAPSNVRLYGATTGTGLDQYLDLKVTRGTGGTTFPSCTGFTNDSTNHGGFGAGVIYSGTLQGFGDNYGAGLVDPTDCGSPPCAAEQWLDPETHVYKFEVTLQSSTPNAAQGLTATQDFTWEARNV
jgi:predicted ribosomally synthesized peptide with SipW-like signal peptide